MTQEQKAKAYDEALNKIKLLYEQKPADGKELLYVSNKSYNIGYRDGKREAESKQEWSEEDDWKRKELIQYLEEKGDYRTVWMTWLKSLRPSWKPSEEQMYSLGSVVKGAGEATEGSIAYHLKELYNQLEKLVR